MTRCDVEGARRPRRGTRDRVARRTGARIALLDADARAARRTWAGSIELVEFDEPGDLSWTNLTGIDQRGRWRLRDRGDGTHEGHAPARVRVPGRRIRDHLGPDGRADGRRATSSARSTTCNVRSKGEDRRWLEPGTGLTGKIGYALGSAKVLVDAGVIRPIRPDKLVKVITTLARFGRSPAAGTISLAARYPDEPMIVDELGTLTFGEVHRRTNALATPSRTPASRRATAWGSCAATTAASSSRPSPCRSSAPTRST